MKSCQIFLFFMTGFQEIHCFPETQVLNILPFEMLFNPAPHPPMESNRVEQKSLLPVLFKTVSAFDVVNFHRFLAGEQCLSRSMSKDIHNPFFSGKPIDVEVGIDAYDFSHSRSFRRHD